MRKRKHVEPLDYQKIGQVFTRKITINPPVWNPSTSFYNGGICSQFPNRAYSTCFDELHEGPPYKEGGPFNKWVFRTNAGIPQATDEYIGNISGLSQSKYVGGFVSSYIPLLADYGVPYIMASLPMIKAPGDTSGFGSDGSHTWGDFSFLGPSAWNKFRPGKPAADAGVFFGEIHEVPRMLKDAAKKWRDSYVSRFGKNPYGKLKDRADTWLGLQFGWLPFLSDLAKFYKAWKKMDRIISWLIENNGKWVKRRGVLDSESYEFKREVIVDMATTEMGHIKTTPILGNTYYPGSSYAGRRILSRITGRMIWFEGLFRYYIPNIKSVVWNKNFIRKFYGLQLTPSLVWELTPWSWLIDWFSNVGDVLSNYSETGMVNNLAAKYAYLMGSTYVTLLDEHKLGANTPIETSFWYTLERKTRTEANPFGFGVSWEDLNPRQWSILAALGLKQSQF